MQVHTGERVPGCFPCEFCEKKFTWKCNLYKHTRVIHKEEKLKRLAQEAMEDEVSEELDPTVIAKVSKEQEVVILD